MKNQEILNQEEQDQELFGVIKIISSLYTGASKQISYSDSYNSIYKLCKKGYAEEILNQLWKLSVAHFQVILTNLQKEESVPGLIAAFEQVSSSIERISQILLYIDSNYMNDPKKQHRTVKQAINSIFFKTLYEKKSILNHIASEIAESRIIRTEAEVAPLIQTINRLDQKEVFFPEFVYGVYQQKVSDYLKNLFKHNYEKFNFRQFLVSTCNHLKQERQWLHKQFTRGKGKKMVEQLIKKIYEESLDQLKQKFYKEHSEQLFKTETLQCLQLLNQKKQQKQINDFNDWYINEVKKKLSVIDRKNNTAFLKAFLKQYFEISKYLSNIKNYNINFKVIFFFENWINEDKNQLPKRLNIFCESIVLNSKADIKQEVFCFVVLFKFLKEKNYFQKQFRRVAVLRMIYDSNKSHTEVQNAIISQMGKQCAPQWIEKLDALKKSSQESGEILLQNASKVNVLAIEESAWPFQKLKTNAVLPKQLISLAGNYKSAFEQKFKGRVLQWHPFQGYTYLTIKFNTQKYQFKMDSLMTTILLNLQQFNFKSTIKQTLNITNLSIEQVIDQLTVLQKQKIILLQADIKDQDFANSTISMNLEYAGQKGNEGKVINLIQRYLDQQFVESNSYEELKAQKKMMVEAFIIKIMKSNKTVSNAQLHKQITPMIESRGYKFNQSFVMKALAGLIDKRYIKQLEEGTYSYLAS